MLQWGQADGEDIVSKRERTATARSTCEEIVQARKDCYEKFGGAGPSGNNCLREELQEKRCLSRVLCPSESAAFYGKGERKAKCALWAESFCFGSEHPDPSERERHLSARVKVNARPDLRKKCRRCMHIDGIWERIQFNSG